MFGIDEAPAADAREYHFVHPIGVVRAWDVSREVGPEVEPGNTVFVLLYGLGTGARLFQAVTGHLRRHGRVVVLDLPGFHNLPRPRQAMDIPAFGRAAADILDCMGVVGPVVLLGHSMGCQVAVELVRNRPEFGGHVVLAAPVLPPHLQKPSQVVWACVRDVPRERLGAACYSVLGYVQAGLRWLVQTAPAVIGYPFEQRVTGLGGELVVVRGEHDTLCTAQWARRVVQLSGSRACLEAVPGAAHQLVVDHAEAVARAALLVCWPDMEGSVP